MLMTMSLQHNMLCVLVSNRTEILVEYGCISRGKVNVQLCLSMSTDDLIPILLIEMNFYRSV